MSLRAIVGVGLISYSLYLWHWPIIVFTQYYLPREIARVAFSRRGPGGDSDQLASWRYIELPFRDRKRITRRTVFAGSALACSLLLAVAIAVLSGAAGKVA